MITIYHYGPLLPELNEWMNVVVVVLPVLVYRVVVSALWRFYSARAVRIEHCLNANHVCEELNDDDDDDDVDEWMNNNRK